MASPSDTRWDVVIVGSGAGGSTLAWALKDQGAKVLVLERGGPLPREADNWDPRAVLVQKKYRPRHEEGVDGLGRALPLSLHYWVGGATRLYGAALLRMREGDFAEVEHEGGGVSPAWPIRYEELEPFYAQAEALYAVHGEAGVDPTEPPRSQAFPFPPVPHDPSTEELLEGLRREGVRPFPLPLGLDLRPGGRCQRCSTCDSFPCQVEARADAVTAALSAALERGSVTLWTSAFVRRLREDGASRRVVEVEVEKDGQTLRLSPRVVVLAAGAVNTPLLLLRSGLANGSGMVGRHYMSKASTVLVGLGPKPVDSPFAKTWAVHDFYWGGAESPHPMGTLQAIGTMHAEHLQAIAPFVPRGLAQPVATRARAVLVMTETLPDPEHRVSPEADGRIRLAFAPNNLAAHARLVRAARRLLRRTGHTLVLQAAAPGGLRQAHECGTARMGADGASSVVNPRGQSHDHPNLFVADASVFPAQSAVNPTLTIIAHALRVAPYVLGA